MLVAQHSKLSLVIDILILYKRFVYLTNLFVLVPWMEDYKDEVFWVSYAAVKSGHLF